MEDRYGLEVTTSSAAARDAYVEGIDRMLAADGRVEEALGAAIEADPQFALPHAALARQHQLLGRGGEARETAETAVSLAGGASKREQRHVDILANVISGKVPQSLELTKEHLQEYPRDAFALSPACGVFGSIGFSGRLNREDEQLALLEPLADHYGDDWWFLTVHAFALLETGEWLRARALAERSLEIRPGNSHGAHTLTHTLYEAGADDEATEFLAGWLPHGDPASLMHCHNWWHYAILLTAGGRPEDAWTAVRDNCMPGTSESPSINVFTDVSSFLWRSELAGDPRNRDAWQTVREYYESNFRRPIVFVDAHAGLAYAALDETQRLAECTDQLQELGESGRLPADTIGASLARAYGAFAAEEWGAAIDILEPLRPDFVRIGGSRAQRDLMVNTLLAAYVNDGRDADAQKLLSGVTDRQPSRPVRGLQPA